MACACIAGTTSEGTLEDKIIFHDSSELSLSELRRRARALGGRFHAEGAQERVPGLE